MKSIVKWVFAHEPALLAGLVAAAAVVVALCYGTKANGIEQWMTGGTVAGIFGTLRGFVTSPAGRSALDTAQADLSRLPGLVADVNQARQLLGPALKHPAGLAGVLEAHLAEVRNVTSSTVEAVRGMLRANAPVVSAPAAPATPTVNTPAPAADLPPEIAALAPTG